MPVSRAAYTVKSIIKMSDPKSTLIRIEPADLSITLREIYMSISDLCWISKLPHVSRAFMTSIQNRSEKTVVRIEEDLKLNPDSSLASSAGEYVVSELAHSTIVNDLNYLDIPLPELFKEKVKGNPGFDFYSVNPDTEILLFGEAKYKAKVNAYDAAFEQIDRFVVNGKDIDELASLEHFCSESSQEKVVDGIKGYIAAFSSTSMSDEVLVAHIEKDEHYKRLLQYEEVVCVAVNLS